MENNLIKQQASNAPEWFISSDSMLNHWQNHRKLTRLVIEAFPDGWVVMLLKTKTLFKLL